MTRSHYALFILMLILLFLADPRWDPGCWFAAARWVAEGVGVWRDGGRGG